MTNTETTKIFQERFEDLYNKYKQENDLTYSKLEESTGISRAALTKYLNDNAEIGINNLVKLARFFNVSTDYLLGLSDVKTMDIDKKMICEYTGLSELAVESLTRWEFVPYLDITNMLLEQEYRSMCAGEAYARAINNAEMIEISKEYEDEPLAILSEIQEYLLTTKIKNQMLNITGTGNILTDSQHDELWKITSDFNDWFNIGKISNHDIIERVLFDRIEDMLKKLKNKYREMNNSCPQ